MQGQQKQQYDLLEKADCQQEKCVKVKDQPLVFRVKRDPQVPQELLRNKADERIDEVLILDCMDLPPSEQVLEVFIDFPGADENTTANVAEYVGSVYCTTQRPTTNPRFSIRQNLKRLQLENAPEILVTIVPKGSEKDVPVPFKGAEIVYA